MSIWFTSDQHFGHKNIITYCSRPYWSVHHMNTELIKKWNEKVQPGDIVYHLGDFAWNQGTLDWVIPQLNGSIHLIRGNHDKRMGKIDGKFAWVGDYEEIKQDDDEMKLAQKIILFHYPIESWNTKHHGSWHLHGHVHGDKHNRKVNIVPGRLDVGVDAHDGYPISYDEVKTIFTKILVKTGV